MALVTYHKSRNTHFVVGSGPNGLAAAIALARAGQSVRVLEAASSPGGGARSAELTLPGFTHDVCSAIHPLAVASPFLRMLPLPSCGLQWVQPPAALAHPFDNGTAAVLYRSVEDTARSLLDDGPAYKRAVGPLAERWEALLDAVMAPQLAVRHPLLMSRFGVQGVRSARGLAHILGFGPRAAALFGGICAHASAPITQAGTAAFGLVLAVAGHGAGWPFPRGGAQRLTDALIAHLQSLGGDVVCDAPVTRLDELADAQTILLDLVTRGVLAVAGERLPAGYARAMAKFRFGPGAFKMDWALNGPIPWRARECTMAGTVHLGGDLEEIAESEAAVDAGGCPERPYVILAQHTLFDPSRAPAGGHTAWAYCHVPNGSEVDMTDRIEAQIERFAPGFRDRILARSVRGPRMLEQYNRNLVGGDVGGGASTLRQLLFRPVASVHPYTTPIPRVYVCSASTPPGGGVHGMCGWHAARAALRYRQVRQ